MARIRSIHPGLATDEAYMSASMAARVLIPHLWTEAWDDGVFEWKPVVLKARIFPADNVSMSDLLDELVTLNFIQRVEVGGKPYGLIRNFARYQRPKKPNKSPIDTEPFADYLGLVRDKFPTGTEPVPHQFGTGTEKSPQMEDGGGKGRENNKRSSSTTPREPAAAAATAALDGFIWKSHYDEIESALRDAAGYENNPAPGLFQVGQIMGLMEEGFDLQRDILPVIRAKAKQLTHQVQSWNYFIHPIREAKAKAAKSAPATGTTKPARETTAEFLAKYAGEKAAFRLSFVETLPDVTDDDRRALLAEVLKDAKIDLETERGRRWMAQILIEGRDDSVLKLSITGPERGRIINTYGRLLLGEGWRERELALLDAERKSFDWDLVARSKKQEPSPSAPDEWDDFDDLPAGFAQAGAGA